MLNDRFAGQGQGGSPAQGLSRVLWRFRRVLIGVGLMSGVINILYLTGSFYMLQVYDRVIPSRSIPTLVALSILAIGLFMFQAALELVRGRVLVRLAGSLDFDLSDRTFDLVTRMPLRTKQVGDGQQPIRDLDTLRNFLVGPGLTAFFDLPWMPIYVFLCFMFHPMIGAAVLVGALILFGIALATEMTSKGPALRMSALAARRGAFAEAGRRNAEAINAMGMGPGLGHAWQQLNTQYMEQQRATTDFTGALGSLSRFIRMILQSGVLALGAYLVIEGQATGGVIIAASILSARALAPVDLAIANWRGFVAARQGVKRLFSLLDGFAAKEVPLSLPSPSQGLLVQSASVAPPGGQTVVVQDVSFELRAGDGLGIIGPSASGKSSLARALVGIWTPARGRVRLDGAALEQWDPVALGRHVGYLPQDVELFAGTIAENIARFEPQASDEAVIAAARAAGVHDLILKLPGGYGTPIGEGGAALSAGQRQRIGLARALYGDPFLVVLDEPNSNLDQEGEQALTKAIVSIRQRGGIAVVVAHRQAALAAVDKVLFMVEGRQQDFGPRDEVLKRILRPQANTLSVVGEAGKAGS